MSVVFRGVPVFLAIALLFFCDAFAARIILKSGKEIDCRIVEKTQDYVKVDFNGTGIYYQLKYVREIIEDGAAAEKNTAQPESGNEDGDFFRAALELAAEGRFKESAEKFREGLELSPGDYNLQEGLKMAEDAASGNVPADYAVLVFRGTSSMAGRKYDEALAAFEEAVKLNPQDANLYYYLGVSSYFTGDSGKAEGYLEKAAELSPEDPEIYFNLGINRFSLGDYKGAVESLKKAAGLSPGDGEISSLLGTAAYLNGDFSLARSGLSRAAEIFEEEGRGEKAAEVRDFLKKVPAGE